MIVYVSQSMDHGVTWSAPKAIHSADLQLTQVVAANGVTYLSYVDFTANTYPVRVATGGSDAFGEEVTGVADPDTGGWILPNTLTLSVTTHTMAIDISPGPYCGTVYRRTRLRKSDSAPYARRTSTPKRSSAATVTGIHRVPDVRKNAVRVAFWALFVATSMRMRLQEGVFGAKSLPSRVTFP